jgi:hypothetical protein
MKALAALAAATLLPAAAALAQPAQPGDTVATYESAEQAFKAERCDQAAELMARVIKSPDFHALERTRQAKAFGVAARCAVSAKDWDKAYHLLVAATAYPESEDWVFIARVQAADAVEDWEHLVTSLEVAARLRPAAVSALPMRRLNSIKYEVLDRGDDKALSTRFLAALELADYKPHEPFFDASAFWLDLATDLADAGDMAGAARVLRRIDVPFNLTRALVDRRFFAIVDADPQHYDVHAVAERRLAEDRATAAANPNLIQGPTQVAADLRMLGRSEEALALLVKAEPMLQSAAVTDLDEYAAWYWNERSQDLHALGRMDEAATALQAGAAKREQGGLNVSQVLNLADLYVQASKPEAALKLVEPKDPEPWVSPYGRMVLAYVRVCAYAQLGRKAEMDAERGYIRAHEGDNWGAATGAPICAGDLDAAAAAFERALDDPKGRQQALIDLSEFEPTGHATAFEQLYAERLKAVAARPEVKAAAEKAGRTMHFHIAADI